MSGATRMPSITPVATGTTRRSPPASPPHRQTYPQPQKGSILPLQQTPMVRPINISMRTVYEFLGDILRRQPSDLVDRLTPWLITILGSALLALVGYGWLTARSTL